jgi:hypothetical protein
LKAVTPLLEDLERLLHRARPTPRPDFVRELERSLIPPEPARRPPRLRLAIGGLGFATALAALAILLGVAGVLPNSSGTGRPAQAKPNCRTVVVKRVERTPYFTRDRHGQLQVRYHLRTRPHYVRHCG